MPRRGLDSAHVVTAAAELIDAEGLAALSLSALAARLGVRSPSLYAHVNGLEDLRGRVASLAGEALGDRLARAAAGVSARSALLSVGRAYRAWGLEHPGLYALIELGGHDDEPGVARVLELIFAVLSGYGLDGDSAVHAARSVRAALHGWVHLESRTGFHIPVDTEASFEWMLATLDRGLATPATTP